MALKAPLLATLACVVVANAAGAPAPSAFPLSAGNRWTYKDTLSGFPSTVSVTRVSGSVLALHGWPGVSALTVRKAGTTVDAWDRYDVRFEPVLQLGRRVGSSYRVDLADTTLWSSVTVTVASRSAVVRDGRGKTLRGCIRLTFRYSSGLADAGLEELVFAPGVGLVRWTETTIAGPRTHVLTALRLPG